MSLPATFFILLVPRCCTSRLPLNSNFKPPLLLLAIFHTSVSPGMILILVSVSHKILPHPPPCVQLEATARRGLTPRTQHYCLSSRILFFLALQHQISSHPQYKSFNVCLSAI
ncbi:hypothetical protein B0H17DRAFT_1070391 [Mycena rosella]|uniref:Uncharacterized protein n=1 Tax=Mycena rosella TaxID=1033263 RepID=A0AAD7DB25_MYCRO|nr:hypothetical protein B0H17DRAFT_1070391 [Mycena rosella]